MPCEAVHVTSDFPAEAILAAAKKRKCDLIFMASHGRRGLRGVLLGSETQKVLAQLQACRSSSTERSDARAA